MIFYDWIKFDNQNGKRQSYDDFGGWNYYDTSDSSIEWWDRSLPWYFWLLSGGNSRKVNFSRLLSRKTSNTDTPTFLVRWSLKTLLVNIVCSHLISAQIPFLRMVLKGVTHNIFQLVSNWFWIFSKYCYKEGTAQCPCCYKGAPNKASGRFWNIDECFSCLFNICPK